jgi:hypothetical protein
MLFLDLDLDTFVRPVAYNRRDEDPRLSTEDYSVWDTADTERFLRERCLLDGTSPGYSSDHHVAILDVISGCIAKGILVPPFDWIHVDAHDDFWGHFSKPPNSGNFLYECIRRAWIRELTMVFPPDVFDFPAYILSADQSHIQFEGHSVPVHFSDTKSLQLTSRPDYVFFARSPAFTPIDADNLYNHVRGLFRECPGSA